MTRAACRLKPLADSRDWQDFHRIRQAVLRLPRGRTDHDPNHPDDRHPGHTSVLLTRGETAPGAVGFHEATGWHRFPQDIAGHAADCVQMRKFLSA